MNKVKRLSFIDKLKLFFNKDLYVSTRGTRIISIDDKVSTKHYLNVRSMQMDAKNKVIVVLTEENKKLEQFRKDCMEHSRNMSEVAQGYKKELSECKGVYKVKNDDLRKERFKLTSELSKLKTDYEDKLFSIREKNRELKQRIEKYTAFGVSEASEELKKLVKQMSNKKFFTLRRSIKVLENEVESLTASIERNKIDRNNILSKSKNKKSFKCKEVVKIREAIKNMTYAELANIYDVSTSTIRRVVKYKTYKNCK